jgi:putative membrane protein
MTTAYGFVLFFGYLALSLTMLAAFTWLYIRVTPYDDIQDITDGKMAPAIALTGAMLGFTFPLLVASYVQASIPGFVLWSVISCCVQLAVFWALHRVLRLRIETNNAAGATCYAAAAVCAGLLNAASFIP